MNQAISVAIIISAVTLVGMSITTCFLIWKTYCHTQGNGIDKTKGVVLSSFVPLVVVVP